MTRKKCCGSMGLDCVVRGERLGEGMNRTKKDAMRLPTARVVFDMGFAHMLTNERLEEALLAEQRALPLFLC